MTTRRAFLGALAGGVLAAPFAAEAQPAEKVYRVGVVLEGGPYRAAVEGLRAGLKELGLEEGKHYILHIRDLKGDLAAVGETARNLEQERVDLIFSVTTSVTTAAQRATRSVPIVFYTGRDPVAAGLVKSLAKPGGRLTGVQSRATDLTPKCLEILKEIVPKLRRVVGFIDPGNQTARENARLAQDAARQLRIDFVERPVRSVDELRESLRTLKAGEVDAIFVAGDAMVVSQSQLIVDAAIARKLPTMFNQKGSVAEGGLASYGTSFHAVGRLASKHVQRVLSGTKPADLPVERIDRFELIVNLKTARAIGVTIPHSVLGRADELIQ